MNALKPPRRSLATVAVKPATSPVSANSQVPATTVATPEVDSLVVPAVRNATSAVKSDTLLATVPRAAVASAVVTVALAVVSKPATPAVDTATWPVTAHRVRSATTVSLFSLGLLGNDRY